MRDKFLEDLTVARLAEVALDRAGALFTKAVQAGEGGKELVGSCGEERGERAEALGHLLGPDSADARDAEAGDKAGEGRLATALVDGLDDVVGALFRQARQLEKVRLGQGVEVGEVLDLTASN